MSFIIITCYHYKLIIQYFLLKHPRARYWTSSCPWCIHWSVNVRQSVQAQNKALVWRRLVVRKHFEKKSEVHLLFFFF